MRTIEVKLYSYDELSPSAQAKARDWWRSVSADDSFWSESVIDDAERMGNLLGITFDKVRGTSRPAIYFSGFSSQGDGACFEGSYAYRVGSVAAIAKEAPERAADGSSYAPNAELNRIARTLAAIQQTHFYCLTAQVKHSGRYSYENSVSVEVDGGGDRYFSPAVEEDLVEALRDFMRWIYRALEREYDWANADEQVADNICANGYEFTEDGKLA